MREPDFTVARRAKLQTREPSLGSRNALISLVAPQAASQFLRVFSDVELESGENGNQGVRYVSNVADYGFRTMPAERR